MENRQTTPHVDDFNRIKGIGPAIAESLHNSGILTYTQLSTLTPNEILSLISDIPGLSVKRITQQDWIGQAKQLAGTISTNQLNLELADIKNGQHYAVFTIELLLNADNTVQRTIVKNVRSRDEDSWAGWQWSKVEDFIKRQSGLKLPAPVPVSKTVAPEIVPPAKKEPVAGKPQPKLSGAIGLQVIDVLVENKPHPQRVLTHDQPFTIRLTLDLAEVDWPGATPLYYTLTVYGKNLKNGTRQLVGTKKDRLHLSELATIEVNSPGIPVGDYRLEAIVNLSPQGQAKPGNTLMAMLESAPITSY